MAASSRINPRALQLLGRHLGAKGEKGDCVTAVWDKSLTRVRRAVAGISPFVLGVAFIRTWVHGATPLLPAEPLVWGITAENMFDVTCAITALALALFGARLGSVYLNHRFVKGPRTLLPCPLSSSG